MRVARHKKVASSMTTNNDWIGVVPNRYDQEALHAGVPLFKPAQATIKMLKRLGRKHPGQVDDWVRRVRPRAGDELIIASSRVE